MSQPHALNALTQLTQHYHSIPAGERRWLGNLVGALPAIVVAQLARQNQQQLFVLVTNTPSEVSSLAEELRFFGITPHIFPDWEILPYDTLSPHQDIVSERLAMLSNMPTSGVLVIAISTLAQRVAPTSWILGQHFDIQKGQTFNIERERNRLSRAGYRAVDTVFEAGEYALRGSLMDIFAMGQSQPIRIELFDEQVESLRLFDVETQRTISQIDRFTLLPAREFPLIEGRSTFRARFSEMFPEARTQRMPLYQDVLNGVAATGIEYYLPLFFEADAMREQGTLFDYFPEHTQLIHDVDIEQHLNHFWLELNSRYDNRKYDIDKPILAPNELFLNINEIFARCKNVGRLVTSQSPINKRAGVENLLASAPPELFIDHKSQTPFAKLTDYIAQFKGRILLVAESAGRRESLRDLLRPVLGDIASVDGFYDFITVNTSSAIAIATAPLERGLVLADEISVIVESQLFGGRVIQQRRRQKASDVSEEFLVKSLSELNVGAPVVHIDHGVGRYGGLQTLAIDGQDHEFLQIDYADNAKVYVPVANLHFISRYGSGDPDHAPLHKLGTDAWNKAKRKAIEQIHDVAAELLNIQARRVAKPGIAFNIDEVAYNQFTSQFAFEETADQANAILATLSDMQKAKPMDRLVCGDVGFGKTEVAMRAAFVAVHAGKQVAVLVPTTLLAQQHYDNFCDRFADWPIRVEVLSRFGSSKDHKKIITDLADGKVDIVIGTHKLIQPDIKFANLGLMIVDEEHRFGVRDKEKIKAMRSDVDMLTLTATPIPRTLNMAFSGMRDLSIIATPPARRLAVKTFVMESKAEILKEAILRELLRGGQVYILHNDVDSIEIAATEVRKLVPEARVAVAHGQMRERELERTTSQFYHKQYNVLVCSTIIETGIDVPNANTIIIERADKLGLAQLHQLRGRVGRSHHQAYAYLLVPSIKHLKGDAEKRLDAIVRASDLGAGFILASEDLEIRGAGEILGEEQSGNMNAVGFSLYMDLLARATKAIQQGKAANLDAPLAITSDISLGFPALIPNDYLGDVHQRLLFYKRISNTVAEVSLHNIKVEMIDRFGNLPIQTQHLFDVHKIRLIAEKLGINKIVMTDKGGSVDFSQDTPVEAIKIIKLMQSNPNQYRLDGGQRLKIVAKLESAPARIAFITQLLALL